MPHENVKDSRVTIIVYCNTQWIILLCYTWNRQKYCNAQHTLLHCYTWKRQHLLQYVAYIFALLI